MEAVAVALLVVLPVGITGAVGYAVMQWQRGLREARARTFAAVARRYGLAAGAESATGTLDGVAATAKIDWRTEGKSTVAYTVVMARMHPALDLGLVLRSASWGGLTAFEALFQGIQDRKVGNPALDRAFLIGADEQHRVAALLHEPVASGLLEATRAAQVLVNDAWVQLEERGEPREEFIAWALATAARIARAVEVTRMRVPPATALAKLTHGYQTAAGALGLQWMPTPLALGGTIEGISVYSGAVRVAQHRYAATGTAVFPTSLGCGLSVKSSRHMALLDKVFSSKDVELGDAAFDEAFVVREAQEGRAKHLLTPEVRTGLIALAEVGAIELRDDALQIRMGQIPEPYAVPPLIDKLARVAAAVHQRSRHEDVVRGPYR